MNLPEDPTSIPFGEGERPIPPVEGAWSQMERKLDLNLPASPAGAGSGAAASRAAGRLLRLRPWYGRIGMWAGVGAAAVIAVVATRLVFPRVFPPVQGHMAAAPSGQQTRHGAVASTVPGGAPAVGPTGVPGSPAGGASADGGTGGGLDGGGAGDSHGGLRAGDVSRDARGGEVRGDGDREAGGDEDRGMQGNGGGLSGADGYATSGSNVRANDDPKRNGRGGRIITIPKTRHSPGAVARAFTGGQGTIPVKAADSLLRLTAVKHAGGTVVLAGSRSGRRFRWIPRYSAGIAFKQYVPLPGQQFNDYSADGSRQVYSDYIPSVFLRAAIDSRSYLQLSFGFNSPQYTRDMVIDNTNLQNSTVTGYAAYLEFERDRLKKLFYNELDLTYHYRIADRWRAGAGIQYARLYGGTVESQTILQPANPALADTVYATQLRGMKNTSGYYRVANQRNEWRGIVEIEYCWTRWMLGMRYQQAFQSFYFVINSSAGQHLTNGALSIRASYALWERNRP